MHPETIQTFSLILLWHIAKCMCARDRIVFFPSAYKATRTDAQNDCVHIGGSLVKLTSAEENEEITQTRNLWSADVQWIGGILDRADGTWAWEDQDSVDFTIPESYDLTNGATDDYLAVSATGIWFDAPDGMTSYFVCQVQTSSAEAQAAADARACWVANGLMVPEPGTIEPACLQGTVYFTPESHRVKRSWSDAQTLCQEAGGNLAKVPGEEAHLIISRLRLAHVHINEPWIGGTDANQEGVWSWVDGEAFSWPSFVEQLSESDNSAENCLVHTYGDSWDDRPCTDLRRFVCERDQSLYRKYGDTCFWFEPQGAPWSSAQSACQGAGGALTKIDNAEEYRLIQALDGSSSIKRWIGAHDSMQTNRFKWTDGSILTWTHWKPWEPTAGNEFCTELNDPRWNDITCSLSRAYVCEKPVESQSSYNNLVKTIEMDKVVFRCDEDFLFPDLTVEKQYSCSSTDSFADFLNTITDCQSINIPNIFMESQFEDYTSASIALLFDDNSATCLNLNDYWTYLPLTTVRTKRIGAGVFTVTIDVGQGLESIASLTTNVFVSNAGLVLDDYYGASELFSFCTQQTDLSFDCTCPSVCSVYVRFRFDGMQFVGNTVYSVCEISVTRS